jgi:predicted secreted protein
MLSTPVLDVAIGLSLFYLLLGLICTTLNEMIAGWRKSRANFLDKGIGRLLGDAELKRMVFNHPLIKSLAQDDKQICPSYIPADKFATALMDIVSGKDKSLTDVNAIRAGANAAGGEAFKGAMNALIDESQNDAAKLRANIEAWFNDGMDRVSGWYKRNSQLNALILAILITLIVNADTLTAVHILWTNPVARAEAVAIGEKKVKEPRPAEETVEYEGDKNDATASKPVKAPTSLEEGLSEPEKKLLGELTGWKTDCDKLKGKQGGEWWSTASGIVGGHLLGWILTALAVSLGAPFWFDTLNRFMNIRNAGRAPDERRDKSSSAPPVPVPPQPASPPVTPAPQLGKE